MNTSRISSLLTPLRSAPPMWSLSSWGLFSAPSMARLSRLRVFFGSSSRPHTAPQQYSVMNSWNGRLNSSALFREFSTYSLPSTVLRISSPFSNVCLSMMFPRVVRSPDGAERNAGTADFAAPHAGYKSADATSRNLLRGGARGRSRGGNQIIHRGLHPALAMRHAGERERHLHARQRAQDGEIVGVAEMPDAEIFPGELAEAGPERDVEALERELAKNVGVVALRQ